MCGDDIAGSLVLLPTDGMEVQMNTVGWVILLVLGIPLLGLVCWVIISASLVRIPPGHLGLVLSRGRPTDLALPPGLHFVPTLRRRMVVSYPSTEMALRAGAEAADADTELDRGGPATVVVLGDRAAAVVDYTVRFRLVADRLRVVHDRFGPDGIFPVVRDVCAQATADVLGDPAMGISDLFGTDRHASEQQLTEAVRQALVGCGVELTGFGLGRVDLGRTGEVIQATLRARYELDREQAEADTRMARARNDAALRTMMGGNWLDSPWRYREPDLWNDLIDRTNTVHVALGTRGSSAAEPMRPGETARE